MLCYHPAELRCRLLSLTNDAVVRKLKNHHARLGRARDDAAARNRCDRRIVFLCCPQNLLDGVVLEREPPVNTMPISYFFMYSCTVSATSPSSWFMLTVYTFNPAAFMQEDTYGIPSGN